MGFDVEDVRVGSRIVDCLPDLRRRIGGCALFRSMGTRRVGTAFVARGLCCRAGLGEHASPRLVGRIDRHVGRCQQHGLDRATDVLYQCDRLGQLSVVAFRSSFGVEWIRCVQLSGRLLHVIDPRRGAGVDAVDSGGRETLGTSGHLIHVVCGVALFSGGNRS